jgi:hypothetical protein
MPLGTILLTLRWPRTGARRRPCPRADGQTVEAPWSAEKNLRKRSRKLPKTLPVGCLLRALPFRLLCDAQQKSVFCERVADFF